MCFAVRVSFVLRQLTLFILLANRRGDASSFILASASTSTFRTADSLPVPYSAAPPLSVSAASLVAQNDFGSGAGLTIKPHSGPGTQPVNTPKIVPKHPAKIAPVGQANLTPRDFDATHGPADFAVLASTAENLHQPAQPQQLAAASSSWAEESGGYRSYEEGYFRVDQEANDQVVYDPADSDCVHESASPLRQQVETSLQQPLPGPRVPSQSPRGKGGGAMAESSWGRATSSGRHSSASIPSPPKHYRGAARGEGLDQGRSGSPRYSHSSPLRSTGGSHDGAPSTPSRGPRGSSSVPTAAVQRPTSPSRPAPRGSSPSKEVMTLGPQSTLSHHRSYSNSRVTVATPSQRSPRGNKSPGQHQQHRQENATIPSYNSTSTPTPQQFSSPRRAVAIAHQPSVAIIPTRATLAPSRHYMGDLGQAPPDWVMAAMPERRFAVSSSQPYDEIHSVASTVNPGGGTIGSVTSSPQSVAESVLLESPYGGRYDKMKDDDITTQWSRHEQRNNVTMSSTTRLQQARPRSPRPQSPIMKDKLGMVSLLDEKRTRDAGRVMAWLDSLRLPVLDRRQFLAGAGIGGKIIEMSDGVLLCRLVQKLERRVSIVGTVSEPHSPAQCLQNIRRSLEALESGSAARKFPLSALGQEVQTQVFEGQGDAIVKLLLHIHKAYRGFHQ